MTVALLGCKPHFLSLERWLSLYSAFEEDLSWILRIHVNKS